MHTKISSANPYGHNRWGFAWECVPRRTDAHLDFGCYDGHFLSALKDKQIGRLVGVDVSSEAVEQGQRRFPDLEITNIQDAAPLPFDEATFDSITILDVLEHVSKQHELLMELSRVLKDQGRLILTVPGRHLFSFLDMGNLKFRFPRLHRWYYCLGHSREEYERRYVSNPDGLVGDVSAEKRWHEHFSRRKLGDLLAQAGFSIIDFDGAGFFGRVIGNTRYFFRWLKPVSKALTRLQNLDAASFESTHVFCVAEKRRPE
jgi:SAM-dependent methyltransferase